jgi:hypothetical protein
MILRSDWTLGFVCYTIFEAFMHWNSWHPGAFTSCQSKILDLICATPGMRHLRGSLF